jgi:hypothetical protein
MSAFRGKADMAVCGSQLSRSLCGGPAASARQEVSDFTRRAGEPAPFRVPHHILPEHLARFFSLLIKLFGFWHLQRWSKYRLTTTLLCFNARAREAYCAIGRPWPVRRTPKSGKCFCVCCLKKRQSWQLHRTKTNNKSRANWLSNAANASGALQCAAGLPP